MNHLETPHTVVGRVAKRSVASILWGKILDGIEKSSFREIIIKGMLTLISILLTLIFTFTDKTVEIIHFTLTFKNYMLLKGVFFFLTVFNFQTIKEFAIRIFSSDKKKAAEEEETIEGIPTAEVIDHLIQHKSFKRDDIEQKFGIPRNRYSMLAQKLEDLGILVRGENNARILNERFGRADIASVIVGKENAAELQHNIRTLVSE